MDENEMRSKFKKAKRWNITILCLFTSLLIFGVIFVCIFQYQRTFSRSKWEIYKETRYKFVSDMLAKNDLVGMRESEVIALLGNEDSNGQTSFKMSRDYFPPESTLVYYLGVDFMDTNWLIISLDDNGMVIDYYLDVT